MVANDPVERPDSPDYIANKLRDLQRQIDALTRQSKFPFSISHGGTPDFEVLPDPNDPNGGAKIRILNGAGQPIFETFYSTFYNGKAAHMYDLAGNLVWAQDELAGYGISHPGFSYPTGVNFEGWLVSLTGGVEYTVASGGYTFYHPALWLKGLIQSSAQWQVRLRVIDGTGAEVATSLWSAVQSNSQYFERMVLLPQSAVGGQNYQAQLRLKPVATTSSIMCFPAQTMGTSMAYYNARADAH